MKKITFEEQDKVIKLTLVNEKTSAKNTIEVKDYSITGTQIYNFLSYEKGDSYDVEAENEKDSPQMKELKSIFKAIADKANNYSSAQGPTSKSNESQTGSVKPEGQTILPAK